MIEVSRVRISQSRVRVTTSYSRQEVYDEIVWLTAHDATDDVLCRMWQLIRPNAVVLHNDEAFDESFRIVQDVVEPIERVKRHPHGH